MNDPIDIALHVARKRRDDGGSTTTQTTIGRGGPMASAPTPKFHSGPIHSSVAGRTDHLPIHVESGSYVLPADIVSAGGAGNTLAGFKVLHRTFGGEPYGQSGAPYDQAKGVYGLPVTYARGGKVRAAGILFLSPEREVLLLHRSKDEQDHPSEWAFPAGKLEKGETPDGAARRETREETSYDHDGGLSPFMHRDSHGVDFTTYLAHSERFDPKLNHEHDRAKWVTLDEAATLPLHPGVKAALEKLKERIGKAAGGSSSGVPIVAAGGEHILTPAQVRRVGGGDIDMGHRVLDSFVRRVRAELIGTLKKLPGPRRD
jgi:8-oxo-dGTP pyrophosphatase MutT (NUDIX family)